MSDLQALGEQFANFYYDTYKTNRANLAGLYRPSSMMTYQGSQCMGPEQIMERISQLSFQTINFNLADKLVQPTVNNGCILMCSGQLQCDQDQPLSFTQIFVLMQDAQGWYIHNEFFNLILG